METKLSDFIKPQIELEKLIFKTSPELAKFVRCTNCLYNVEASQECEICGKINEQL